VNVLILIRERRGKPFNMLPVVESNKKIVAMLRLTDFVRVEI
jgi:hypothetical protein